MAKKAYVGVNGVARKVSKIYVGVNGVARKVVKGYVGVNGVAKQFWGDSGKFWFFFEPTAKRIMTGSDFTVTKAFPGIAFYAWVKGSLYGVTSYFPLLVSTDQDGYSTAVSETNDTKPWNITKNGDTWRCVIPMLPESLNASLSPQCILSNDTYVVIDNDVCNAILNRIYTDDFAENYQLQQYYNLNVTDIEKTIKKAFAIFLYKNIHVKSWASYSAMLSGLNTILNYVNSEKGNNTKIVINIGWQSNSNIQLVVYYSNDSTSNKQVTVTSSKDGYNFYNYFDYLTYNTYTRIVFDSSGNVSHNYGSFTGNLSNIIGADVGTTTVSSTSVKTIILSNIGITL